MLVASNNRAGSDEERSNVRIKYSNGVYEGEIMKGKPHGNGTRKWTNGNDYVGGWEDGRIHGNGTYKYASGSEYKGNYKNGKADGIGTFRHASGSEYTGEWENDKQHGNGTYKWTDGDSYTGEWKNGKGHGNGTYKYANGNEYTGEWENGKMHGTGTFKNAGGSEYKGNYKNGKKHGNGTYRLVSGEIYNGEYENCRKHGTGKLKEAGSDVYNEVVYNQGKLVRGKRMASIVDSPPAKRPNLRDTAVSAGPNTEIPELEIERNFAVESSEPGPIVTGAAVGTPATCKENTVAELIDKTVAITTMRTGGDKTEETQVQDEGPSNPNEQAEPRINNKASNIAPNEIEKAGVKDSKAEEKPPAQSSEEPDTQEDDSLNEREVKFDYKEICKKLTVKVETQKAKMEGMKTEIKSLKKELARRYNTDMY